MRASLPAVLGVFALGLVPAQAAERGRVKSANPEALFLDLTKVHLGTIASEEDKKKYLSTIQLEKSRITRKTVQAVYENAHSLYRAGDFEAAQGLTSTILSIDPAYEDASVLQRATIELKGSGHHIVSERKLVENKFNEGMALYRQGRLVEAAEKLDEATKLAPNNLKAVYWLRKIRAELAEDHFRRGQAAYRQHRLRETLDQWYAALVLNPRYPRLVSAISRVETELRQADVNDKLQTALQFYGEGKSDESLRALDQALQVQPGDPRAQRLRSEIRAELANQRVAEGRRLYSARQYTQAIARWKSAVDHGYDPRVADILIARTKEQMKREADAKRRVEEEARRREEEAQRKAQEEAARKAQSEKEAQEASQKTLQANPPAERATPYPGSLPAIATEENRRSAGQHQSNGIIYYQKGEYEKARDEWLLCKQLDPSNSECVAGLQRIDQQFGGP